MKRPQADLRKLAVASAASPMNLGVLGTGTLGTLGLVLAGKPIIGVFVLALGVVAYGALIGLDMFNDKFIRKVYELPDPDDEQALEAPAPAVAVEDIEPVDLRRLYASVLTARQDVLGAVHSAGDLLQESLRDTVERCAELVQEAGRLARRGTGLQRYMSRENPRNIASEAEDLDAQAAATRDDTAAQSFRKAAQSKRQQLETYNQLQGFYDRIKAQLSVIETSLDGVQAKIVKLNATDIEEAASIGASITQHLDALSSDMHMLESTVSETLEEFNL